MNIEAQRNVRFLIKKCQALPFSACARRTCLQDLVHNNNKTQKFLLILVLLKILHINC